MSAWWASLAERDRRFLSIGAAIVALLLFWALWFDPLRAARRGLADSVQQGEADLVYMQAAAQRLATLQSGGSASVFDRGGRPYHGRVKAVAEGAREAGLQL